MRLLIKPCEVIGGKLKTNYTLNVNDDNLRKVSAKKKSIRVFEVIYKIRLFKKKTIKAAFSSTTVALLLFYVQTLC